MKSKLLGILVALLMWTIQANAAPVIIGDREWLQPVDFVNLSWSEINEVCPAVSDGVCTGSLNGNVLDGYTWAGVDDVNALFNSFIGFEALGPGPTGYREENSEWAYAWFKLFLTTPFGDESRERRTWGWSRDSLGGIQAWSPILNQNFVNGLDDAITGAVHGVPLDEARGFLGGWFYTEVFSVPEPATLALLSLGLVGIGYARRRKPN